MSDVRAYTNGQRVSVTKRSGWRKNGPYFVPSWYPVAFYTWTFQHWVELDSAQPAGEVETLMYEVTF